MLSLIYSTAEDDKEFLKTILGSDCVEHILLFYTNSVDFRLVRIRDICVFHYDHEARVWTVVAAGCDRPLRLKRGVSKDVLLGIDDSFVQVSQKFIVNINYLLEVRDNICRFYPPFEDIDYVKVGRFFRRKLISRYSSL